MFRTIIILNFICLFFLSCSNKGTNVANKLTVKMNIEKSFVANENTYYFHITITNDSQNEYGLVYVGNIKSKVVDKIISVEDDCILEIEQDGEKIISTDFVNKYFIMDNHEPEFIHFNKGETKTIFIRYGDFVKYFNITNREFKVRLIIIPNKNNLDIYKRIYDKSFDQKYSSLKMIEDTITTPFISYITQEF